MGRPAAPPATSKMPIPREHGAWALVYGPLALTALAYGHWGWRLPLLLVAATALFMAHEPLSRIARAAVQSANRERIVSWWKWAGAYAGCGALAGGLLIPLYDLWLLPLLGGAVGVVFGVHLLLIRRRVERSVAGELLAVFGLTATAPIAYYVLQSRLDWTALHLWLLNVLYFSSGIFFVKMTVSRHVGRPEAPAKRRDCALYHGALLPAAVGVGGWVGVPWTAGLSVLAVVVRAFWGYFVPPEKLNLKKIGYLEVCYTALFVAILGIGLRLSP